jgi:hypothetical protein
VAMNVVFAGDVSLSSAQMYVENPDDCSTPR